MTKFIRKQHKQPWLWRYRFSFTFAATFAAAFLYLLLFAVGFVPQSFQYSSDQPPQAQAATAAEVDMKTLESIPERPKHELPNRVTIPAVNINTTILHPASRQAGVLNDYLDRGAVRYPQSGYPGNGNLFLFGHSTSHETVWNQAYKTFNRLENVNTGDEITVQTDSGIFYYEVSQKQIKKNSQAYVPLNVDKDMLTISTCDSFGSKEDRVVVQADFKRFTPNQQ